MQITGDNISIPYHVHTWKSSSPILPHPKTQTSVDTKHTSPKKMDQHSALVKLNTIYAFARPCVVDLESPYLYSIRHQSWPPFYLRALTA